MHTSLEAEIDIRRANDETKHGANEDGSDGKLSGFFGGIGIRWEGVAVIYKAYSIRIIAVQFAALVIRRGVLGGLGMLLVDWGLLFLSYVCVGSRLSDLVNAGGHGLASTVDRSGGGRGERG